jgi:uncharacterized lipoprotein YbaY
MRVLFVRRTPLPTAGCIAVANVQPQHPIVSKHTTQIDEDLGHVVDVGVEIALEQISLADRPATTIAPT